MKKLKLGIIGLGARGFGLFDALFFKMIDEGSIDITAVCDLYEDRTQKAADSVETKTGTRPLATQDYREVIACDEVEAVLVLTAWESHIKIATASMKAGKPVGIEVGGAYSIDDCFHLIHTYEETGVECMMLENCCFGRRELMVLNMVKKGLFGDIVHCAGGYMHDLRDEITNGDEIRHYRKRNYLLRNCENYPTHELGPIAKILDINKGNRMLYLTSIASCSKGLHQYIVDKKGADHPDASLNFAQGDIVTTTIKCAGGQTIVLTLDTTLPRIYSRGLSVRGTKGMYNEDGNYVHLDGESEWESLSSKLDNFEKYAEEYEHPMWVEYKKNPIGGHDGIDWLVYNSFVKSAAEGTAPPIDTYDTATWMSISCLSEQSVAGGGIPVAIPDFTGGRWIERTVHGDCETGIPDKI